MSIKIAEMFASIQGEGIESGSPSIFIRVSGCNLRCGWCDTPYASWEPEGEKMSLDQIIDYVNEHPSYPNVVITGGEPFMFPILPRLVERLKSLSKNVSIETSGTLYQQTSADLITISPKLKSSSPNTQRFPEWAKRHEASRFNPSVLYKVVEQSKAVQFQFLVEDADQLFEIEEVLASVPFNQKDRIFFMPQCKTKEELEDQTTWLMEFCKEKGYRFSDRLHIRMWDGVRGV